MPVQKAWKTVEENTTGHVKNTQEDEPVYVLTFLSVIVVMHSQKYFR